MSLRLVADIGGTNARFALSGSRAELTRLRQFRTADYADFDAALSAYLDFCGPELVQRIRSARICAAGPSSGDCVRLTNADWVLECDRIASQLDADDVLLVNDVEAVGHLLPLLDEFDLPFVSGLPQRFKPASRVVLNIGTGLGCSAAHRSTDGNWFVSGSEAGHMTFGAASDFEVQLLPAASTLECLLSGNGVVRLFRFIAKEQDRGRAGSGITTAADVFAAISHNKAAAQTVAVLDELIGRVLGDLVLAHGAWGGAALCGSVAVNWFANMDQTRFCSAFVRKGPMRERMLDCPVALMKLDDPGLLCLTYMR